MLPKDRAGFAPALFFYHIDEEMFLSNTLKKKCKLFTLGPSMSSQIAHPLCAKMRERSGKLK